MKPKLTRTITVRNEHDGERLDKWLAGHDSIPSRSRAAELIERGLVSLKGKTLKPSFRVQAGTEIRVDFPESEPEKLQTLDRPLEILFEDDDLVVVNKPAGLVVHPAAGHAQDTLVNVLLHHVGKLSMGFGERRPGIVHRLDRDTSGVLVAAKNDAAHNGLAAQFKRKSVHRVYWAIVHGAPINKKRTITSHLARHPSDRKRFASNAFGKLAITHYEVLQSAKTGLSWIRCRLETGRTHQIRVHMSEAGHPIVGDVIYGRRSRTGADAELGRLALHAVELGFDHPITGQRLFFHADWPVQLADFASKKGFKDVPT